MSTEPKRGTCDETSDSLTHGCPYSDAPHYRNKFCIHWREGESAAAQACIDCGQPESDKAHDPDCPSIIDRHKFEAVPPAAETATELSIKDIIGIAEGLDDAANGRTKPIEKIRRELAETAMTAEQLQADANELLRELNRSVFNDSIDIDKLPHGVGLVEDFAKRQRTKVIVSAEPTTYGYVYPDAVRYGTNGRQINGCEPTETFPLFTKEQLEAYAMHVREAAQGEIDELREEVADHKKWVIFYNERAETAERKLAELEKEYEHALSCMDRSCKRCGAALASLRAESKEG